MDVTACETCGNQMSVCEHIYFESEIADMKRKSAAWDALVAKLDAVTSSAAASKEMLVSGDEFLSYAISLRAELENDDGN